MSPPLVIKLVSQVMAGFPHPWFLAGDWAVDAWLDRSDRRNAAVVVGLFEDDQLAVLEVFPDWRLVAHDQHEPLGERCWNGRRLEQDSLSMTRPKVYATSPDGLELEIVLHQRSGGDWVLLDLPPPRSPVQVPIDSAIGRTAWGVPAAVPEVLMFAEAFSWRARNYADLGAVLPTLSDGQRRWLRDSIAAVAPDYQWVAIIDRHDELGKPENASRLAEELRAEELEIEPSLVRALLATQFPHWADLPLQKVPSVGTVNDMFRLGEDMAVRLPRRRRFHDAVELRERLAALAPRLPVAIPEVLAIGEPGLGYPWCWSITRWLDGDVWQPDLLADQAETAIEFGNFLRLLHGIDPAVVGLSESVRDPRAPEQAGSDLAHRYDTMRALATATQWVDTHRFLDAWIATARAAAWGGEPVLLHGDLKSDNVLVRDGHLYGVIDWPDMRVGDPAVDIACAWRVFSTDRSRRAFRSAMEVDEDTWERARGMVLGDIFTYHYYASSRPPIAAVAKRFVLEALSEWRP